MPLKPPGITDQIRDQRIRQVVPLATPALLLHEMPLSDQQASFVIDCRTASTAVLNGDDDRLLCVVGPCSVHDTKAALEYGVKLASAAEELREDLCIVMRVYFEKPRTTVGWKGLINDPHLDDSGDVNTGLHMARRLLLDVLDLGLPVGCEFLDPVIPQYIADTVAWGAIGARTTESQTHRQLASGLSMPIGFKNRTDGNVGVAVDAVRAASAPHYFAGIDIAGTSAILETDGNPDSHVILRGGRNAPNHGPESVGSALAALREAGLPERLVIDASHDNSGKDHERQPGVAAEIGEQIAAGSKEIVGIMLESFLVAGAQSATAGQSDSLTYGQSITDKCMDWEATRTTLDGLAEAVRTRRN